MKKKELKTKDTCCQFSALPTSLCIIATIYKYKVYLYHSIQLYPLFLNHAKIKAFDATSRNEEVQKFIAFFY